DAPPSALIPARFLVLTAHLVLLLQAALATAPHVRASLPPEFTPEEFAHTERLLWGALGGALGLLGVELVGFFGGVSMFHVGQGLLSLVSHAGAALTLSLGWSEAWGLPAFCWQLGLCSLPPALSELLLIVSLLCWKRKGL
ncbi:transmembrane protein 107, partial [Phaenicophaeus curvirostris]|uniref:transmembrane protein 107 n=1 Tax=Phaenicophaeus curvirostris TaxID=33595 RepID=UPI0037F0BFCC